MTNTPDSTLKGYLETRNKNVHKVGKIKRKYGKDLRDNQQWQKVLEGAKRMGIDKGVDVSLVEIVWNAIHEVSLKIEGIIPLIPESEQIQDNQQYQQDLSPIRGEIQSLTSQILDCISEISSEAEDAADHILAIVESTGKKSILEELKNLEYNESNFANICSCFRDGLGFSNPEVLEYFGISGAVFDRWCSGANTPGDEKINTVFETMKSYISSQKSGETS